MKFKTILYMLLVFAILALIVMGGFSLLKKASDLGGEPEQEEDGQARVDGVIVNNLGGNDIEGEVLLYMNGDDQVQVNRFKLDSGREKLHARLTGSFNEFYIPGRAVVSGSNVYWIRYKEGNDEVVKISVDLDGQSEKVLYRSPAGLRLAGLNIVSDKEIYFTQYVLKEPTVYTYEVKTIKNEGAAAKVFGTEGANPIVMAGKNSKSQLIYKTFNVQFNRLDPECFLVDKDKLAATGCHTLKGIEYVFESTRPTANGYTLGQKGFIERVDPQGKKQRVLEGQVDEHFESVSYRSGYVYFVSGSLEETFTEGDVSYGNFVPLALERITIDGKNREKLVTLPSSNIASVALIESEFLLLNISIRQSNKFETAPNNLWLLDVENKELEQLTDIQCEGVEFCEVKYLGNY